MMKFINIPVFIISLAVGLFFVYITNPDPKVIFVYPTPNNHNKIQYVDKAENCFSYTPRKVKCPTNSDSIKEIPVQY